MMPHNLFYDITDRTAPGNLHLYVAGFPCQPFSVAGKREGCHDNRGNIAQHVVLYISTHRPKSFILENVDGLVGKTFHDYFQVVIDMLVQIENESGSQVYQVMWEVLNTSMHGGLPQNRPRFMWWASAGIACVLLLLGQAL